MKTFAYYIDSAIAHGGKVLFQNESNAVVIFQPNNQGRKKIRKELMSFSPTCGTWLLGVQFGTVEDVIKVFAEPALEGHHVLTDDCKKFIEGMA